MSWSPPASRTSRCAPSGCSARARGGRPTRRSGSTARPSAGSATDLAGLPDDEQFDQQLRPWARFARQSIPLAGWLSGRHLSRAIDEYSIVESERILHESGFVAERVDAPPAVAFVDLTGFTRLTEERGDDVAAAMAMRLGDVSTDIAEHAAGAWSSSSATACSSGSTTVGPP